MKRKLVFWALAIVVAWLAVEVSLHAQSISPVVSEGKGPRASGEFTVSNAGLQPLTVIVEERSFTASESGSQFRTLDAGIHVKLGATSARVGPRSTETFSYEVQCDQLPCWLSFVTFSTVGHTADGVAVRTSLASTVYLCAKQKGCRASVRRAWGLAD